MSDWQPIATALKDGPHVLVWQPEPFDRLADDADIIMATCPPGAYTAHWDQIDQRWCIDGGTCLGPFLSPTHWQPLPPPPAGV